MTNPATLAYNTRPDHDGGNNNSDAHSDQGDDSDSSDSDSTSNSDGNNSADDTAVLQPARGHVFAQ